jgi:hypothetical protein
MSALLAYVVAALVAAWGIAHAVPTRQVVAGFAPMTPNNRRVLVQEWLAEAFSMWGIAGVIAAVTVVAAGTPAAVWVYRMCALLLAALAVLTQLTGARTSVIWFKICPVLLGTSAALLLVASFA